MAFQSNGPVMLALPPFRGFTRRIVLVAAGAWVAQLVLLLVGARYSMTLFNYLVLQPGSLAHGMVWQVVTYPFIGMGLLSILFALLTVWFFGSRLEDDRGKKWLVDFYFATTVGGAVVATLVSFLLGRSVERLDPASLKVFASGLWPVATALLLAFAWFYPNEEMRLFFVLRIKAKYVAAMYVMGYLALAIFSQDAFGGVVGLTTALCGAAFTKWVPRRGLRYAASETWYSMRNDRLRARRQRAAKEFEVYMRKQGRDVRVDGSGLDDSKDPKSGKWMN